MKALVCLALFVICSLAQAQDNSTVAANVTSAEAATVAPTEVGNTTTRKAAKIVAAVKTKGGPRKMRVLFALRRFIQTVDGTAKCARLRFLCSKKLKTKLLAKLKNDKDGKIIEKICAKVKDNKKCRSAKFGKGQVGKLRKILQKLQGKNKPVPKKGKGKKQ